VEETPYSIAGGLSFGLVFGFLVFGLRPENEPEEGVGRKRAQCEVEDGGAGRVAAAAAMCNADVQRMPGRDSCNAKGFFEWVFSQVKTRILRYEYFALSPDDSR